LIGQASFELGFEIQPVCRIAKIQAGAQLSESVSIDAAWYSVRYAAQKARGGYEETF
jgi:hypothetical protein